jgi:hypothetical protein
MGNVDVVLERERAEADAAASRQMSDLMRGAAGRGSAPTGSTSPLAVALDAHERAKAAGDPIEIMRTDTAVEDLLREARARNAPPVPDFGAGARPPAPATPPTGTDWMRDEAARRGI